MMDYWSLSYLFLFILNSIFRINGAELTVELDSGKKECFYQNLNKNERFVLYFKVVEGGDYDIDLTIKAPDETFIYNEPRVHKDTKAVTSLIAGPYEICFSNEFSTFTAKLVYFELNKDDDLPFSRNITTMSEALTSLVKIHKNIKHLSTSRMLNGMYKVRNHLRVNRLNKRIFWWSLQETLAILIISIGQVYILRRFFTNKNQGQKFVKV